MSSDDRAARAAEKKARYAERRAELHARIDAKKEQPRAPGETGKAVGNAMMGIGCLMMLAMVALVMMVLVVAFVIG